MSAVSDGRRTRNTRTCEDPAVRRTMCPASIRGPMIRMPAVAAGAGLFAMYVLLAGSPARAVVAKRVSGNLVFWDQARGFDLDRRQRRRLLRDQPVLHRVLADGRIVRTRRPRARVTKIRRSWGFSIARHPGHSHGRQHHRRRLGWSAGRQGHCGPAPGAANLTALVNLAVAGGYDGIDLDYETFAPRTGLRSPRSFSNSPERCMRRASGSR